MKKGIAFGDIILCVTKYKPTYFQLLSQPLAHSLTAAQRLSLNNSSAFHALVRAHAAALVQGDANGLVKVLAETNAAPEVVQVLMRATAAPELSPAGLQVDYLAVRPLLANALAESGETVSIYADTYIWARHAPAGESITNCAVLHHLLMTHPLLCSACDSLIKSLYPGIADESHADDHLDTDVCSRFEKSLSHA